MLLCAMTVKMRTPTPAIRAFRSRVICWGQGVAGSNPVSPTTKTPLDTGIQGTNWHEQQRCNHVRPHPGPHRNGELRGRPKTIRTCHAPRGRTSASRTRQHPPPRHPRLPWHRRPPTSGRRGRRRRHLPPVTRQRRRATTPRVAPTVAPTRGLCVLAQWHSR